MLPSRGGSREIILDAAQCLNDIATMNKHSVKNFEPSEYNVVDYLDNKRPEFFGGSVEGWEAAIKAWDQEIRSYFPTWDQGAARQEGHNIRRCTHCGNTNVRYIVAVEHIPSGQMLVFGQDCVEHLDFPNRDAFKAAQVRARAAAGHARMKVFRKRQEFIAANPELACWADEDLRGNPLHKDNHFAQDVLNKLNKYGFLSPAQLTTVIKSLKRDQERPELERRKAQEEAERRATAKPAPRGRQGVTGTVLATKWYASDFSRYGVTKLLIDLDNADNAGSRVWITAPTSLINGEELKGRRISFTATFVEGRDSDGLFAVGKRPTKAEIIY